MIPQKQSHLFMYFTITSSPLHFPIGCQSNRGYAIFVDMDDVKPQVNPKDYQEGPEATKRFLQGVRNVLSTSSPAELKRRHEAWEKTRKMNRKKSK